MKIKGSELIAFIAEAWPKPDDDWYWDHELFDDPDPSEVYDTDEIGYIHYQGSGDDPTDGDGYDLTALIRKWRRHRDHDIFTITVPKEKANAVKAAIIAMGAKVT